MGFFTRLILLVLSIVAAYYMVKYREKLVRMVGKNYYAEKYLGAGGSYTMWVILAAVLVAFAVYFLV